MTITMTLTFVFLLAAFISFLCGALGVSAKINWTDLGFAFCVAATMAGAVK